VPEDVKRLAHLSPRVAPLVPYSRIVVGTDSVRDPCYVVVVAIRESFGEESPVCVSSLLSRGCVKRAIKDR